MQAQIIFCTAVSLAILTVILLALISPVPHENQAGTPWVALSFYIQRQRSSNHGMQQHDTGALIFHRMLTEGPENTSRAVGRAQGFIIPAEHFAHSAFNLIYLTFETPEHSGSLSVHVNRVAHKEREELAVVGGTGSFAFARGVAVFEETDQGAEKVDVTYHIKLQLRFPNRSQTIPG
ncbi:hypothetical protein Nepgr_015707 [Nepenthes gracilis]|uniref:Dirigent protein n=1 Tax=Nepenthes gracilis TaxID=150966 RepID=A0AAD3SNY9_NEPGR|nr:hypothetical protein Nepgr_015707 [Nepenthes gracilis]